MSDSSDYVAITITSNLTAFESEKRYPSTITLSTLKAKLELITGGQMATMKLELRNKDDELIKYLTENSSTLGELGVENGMRIFVNDTASAAIDEETAEEVEFRLSAEEYAKREDTARNFLIKNKLGKYDEEKQKKKAAEEENETKLAESITVGSRCEVKLAGQLPRRGEVKFVGPVHFKGGIWVGVQYDEPVGKNDGSIDGTRYFECRPKYGSFLRPSNITCGDFPEVDELDEI
jgi:tubulin-folding cofactor B